MSAKQYTVVVTKESHITVTVTADSRQDARDQAWVVAGEQPADAWREDQDAIRIEQILCESDS